MRVTHFFPISRLTIRFFLCVFTTMFVAWSCKDDEDLPPLGITAVAPTTAILGDTIHIIGQGFSPGYVYNKIIFNGGAVAHGLPGSTTEELLVEVPDGALSGEMTVNILDTEIANTPIVQIKLPVLNEITPLKAWIGDTLTIRGENFQRTKYRNHVRVGTSEFADVISATATTLRVIVPRDATNGPVSVMGVSGPSFEVNPSVIEAIVPAQGMVGDTIEIRGKGMKCSQRTIRAQTTYQYCAPG